MNLFSWLLVAGTLSSQRTFMFYLFNEAYFNLSFKRSHSTSCKDLKRNHQTLGNNNFGFVFCFFVCFVLFFGNYAVTALSSQSLLFCVMQYLLV